MKAHLTASGRLVLVLALLVMLAWLLHELQVTKVVHDRVVGPTAETTSNGGLGGRASLLTNAVMVLDVRHGRHRGSPHHVYDRLLFFVQDICGRGDAELRRAHGACLCGAGHAHAHALLGGCIVTPYTARVAGEQRRKVQAAASHG